MAVIHLHLLQQQLWPHQLHSLKQQQQRQQQLRQPPPQALPAQQQGSFFQSLHGMSFYNITFT